MRIFDDASTNQTETAILGRRGEELAAKFVEKIGYKLVARNFVAPVGRNRRNAQILAEIDLIAYDCETLVFLEVKTRSSSDAAPETAVDLRKQRQITRAARVYRRLFRLQAQSFRYDVVAVVLPADQKPRIEVLKSFWTDAKFQKRFWSDSLAY